MNGLQSCNMTQTLKKIGFIDVADINNNRDIEPMEGGYGDNYYMQLTYWISKFKNVSSKVNVGKDVTVDVTGSFSQWNNNEITATYRDYTDDVFDRKSFEAYNWSKALVNDTGVNDFESMKVTKDRNNIYFYVKTVNDIVLGNNLMTLFLKTSEGSDNWYGYNYVINRVDLEEGKMVLEKRVNDKWTKVALLDFKVEGQELMLKVPLDQISIKDLSLQFKWADNFSTDNFWSFYTDGDTAPYGRLNYLFQK